MALSVTVLLGAKTKYRAFSTPGRSQQYEENHSFVEHSAPWLGWLVVGSLYSGYYNRKNRRTSLPTPQTGCNILSDKFCRSI